MQLEMEVWLRGNDYAVTDRVEVPVGAPESWTDADVRQVLEALLRAVGRARHPDAEPDRPVFLRGFNWIVSPFEDRGVLVTVEIQLGAAACGPFALDQAVLEAMITRVVAAARVASPTPPGRDVVH